VKRFFLEFQLNFLPKIIDHHISTVLKYIDS